MSVEKIGTAELWIGALNLGREIYSAADLQNKVTSYVSETGRTVTGCFLPESNELLLLHWPETRESYVEQQVSECESALRGLAIILNVEISRSHQLEDDEISCMMGLKVGGYYDGRIADLSEISQYQLQLSMEPAHMVSARALKDGVTESYGEPTIYLTGKSSTEAAIHTIGNQLEQHHYGIQRGSGMTDFYETKWANS